jgi:GTP-binding protein HflX
VVTVYPTTLIERTVRERIVLVGVALDGRNLDDVEAGLDELALLVDTAGADVLARLVQRRDAPDPATFLGKGKVAELHELCLAVDADTVVFDESLTPAQQRNLEKLLGRTAIDRTAVILDIFAQNARSPEGKAQVELALLRYRLPRLRGRGVTLSQQAGGIGRRGPGETQLEVDRRRLVRRMQRLESELKSLDKTRTTQRHARSRGRHREITLVGYTNAGKSSILNAFTAADAAAEDRLFVTLDPRTRQHRLEGGETILLTDTVGFVRNLPHELVEAFASTLDSVRLADLLIHVVDASAPDPDAQIAAVRSVLDEIGAGDVEEMLAINKSDLAPEVAENLVRAHPGAVAVSARTGAHLAELMDAAADRLRASDRVVELRVPFARGDVVAAAHREGEVLESSEDGDCAVMRVVMDPAGRARFGEWAVRR